MHVAALDLPPLALQHLQPVHDLHLHPAMIVLRVTRTLAQRAIKFTPVHTSVFLADEGHPEVASTLAGGELDGQQVNVPPLVSVLR